MSPRFKDMIPLKPGRTHEVEGPGAFAFAALLCGLNACPTLWCRETWGQTQLLPSGMAPFCYPSRVILCPCPSQTNLLASTEEALRSGAVGLVVTEISAPLSLTAGRRLHLAAETGQTTALTIIPHGMGSPATETRWHASAETEAEIEQLMIWQLTKNKSGQTGAWWVQWQAASRQISARPVTRTPKGTAPPAGDHAHSRPGGVGAPQGAVALAGAASPPEALTPPASVTPSQTAGASEPTDAAWRPGRALRQS